MNEAPGQFHWEVTAEARAGAPGSALVTIVARNELVPELAIDMSVDWHAGAEAADVEGRALVILSMLCKELAAECEREAGIRFSGG
jgi:hypothetical protein